MKENQNLVRKPYAFRHWTRKPYAVFNSLKLLLKIGVMSMAYTIVNPVQETKAQADSIQTPKKVELEDVEVSGQRSPVVYSQMARVVSVITRREIEQAPALNVNDLLKYVPQVDIRQRGVNGAQADISIQGGSFDQTLLLLNGINLTDPQTGHYNLTLPFELESVDRIEVLKGPASRVFGTNAFSGAVNFITGLDTNNYVKSTQTTGDFGLYRGSFVLNQHNRNMHNLVSVSKSQSNGYIHNTDYDFKNAFYHGKVFFKEGNAALQLGYSQKKFGANNFYSPLYPNQFDNTDTYFASLSMTAVKWLAFSPVVYWRRNYDHYVLNYTDPAFYQNFHYTDVYGAGINTGFNSSLGKTSLGFEYRKEIIYSTNLGQPISETKKIPGQDSIRYNKNDWRENLSAFLEQNFYVGNFSASVGAMLNRNTKLSHVGLYPGMDVSYRISEPVKWYASVNRSLRLPSFTDLYYKGPQNIGNPDLKPERAWTLETGFKFVRRSMDGNISYFHRWGTDIIDWIKARNSQVWTTRNFTTLNADGAEVAFRFIPAAVFSPSFFVREITFSYSFTTMTKSSDTLDSHYVLDYLRNKVVLNVTHDICKNVGATWSFMWQDRNGTYDDYSNYNSSKTSVPATYKPFFTVDGRIFYNVRYFKLFAEATNLLNVSYIDIGNIAQPGRWFRAGVEVKMGW